VLPVDITGAQTWDQPIDIVDGGGKTGGLYGAYIQDEWRILPKVTINYGRRLDYVNQYTSEGQVSPRVNAVWKPTDTATVTAGYSRYFVPPPFGLVSPSSIALFGMPASPASRDDSAPVTSSVLFASFAMSATASATAIPAAVTMISTPSSANHFRANALGMSALFWWPP
jgi:hypothetical protein